MVNRVLYHKKKYYSGEPEISDAEYDKLEEQLREIDPDNPVLFVIGTPAGGSYSQPGDAFVPVNIF